jgi:hypothetical protein
MMTLLRALTLATLAASGVSLPAQAPTGEAKELTQAEVELRVKNDMARRLDVRPGDVRIAESSARIWQDAGLQCNARRGVLEERGQRIPGFEIVAEAGGRRVVYHTDRRGRLLRCQTPRKPIDRIR